MSKHTPGPWTLDAGNDRNYPSVLISHDWITVNVGDTDETCLANAALIAAAPELLEALKQARQEIIQYQRLFQLDDPRKLDDSVGRQTQLHQSRTLAERAIAKAEGNA